MGHKTPHLKKGTPQASAKRRCCDRNQARFLAAYECAGTISGAAEAAGLNRDRHYRWLDEDATYPQRFAEADRKAVDGLLDEARRQGHEGPVPPRRGQGNEGRRDPHPARLLRTGGRTQEVTVADV